MVVVRALDQKPLILKPLECGLSPHDGAGKRWMSGLGRPPADQPLPTLKLGGLCLCLHRVLHVCDHLFSGAWPCWSAAYAVSKMDDAVSEPALVEEVELSADVVGQGALAAAHHDRPEEQMALVDQPQSERLASELGLSLIHI